MQTLDDIIQGCLQGKRSNQEELYKQFFGYAMGICMRYVQQREEAIEILNDGFLKVFTNIQKFDTTRPFKTWLSKIIANTAIDYLRQKKRLVIGEDVAHIPEVQSSNDELALQKLSYAELLTLVQSLPPAYNAVFNLYVMEGFQHHEIAGLLGISEGTSKSNLFKAKKILKEKIAINTNYYQPGISTANDIVFEKK
ncbi:RNA polymerase sigma factor [Chitinophaga skermanii]|uniref:RNA polymerase sigma factor n=1 Tax=Chitinophaga skermanii TaxID=331697 RepID=UPI001B86674F|nr:sigma-70 family RNA polymerase sigma factor [Chitinophaga skermanii]